MNHRPRTRAYDQLPQILAIKKTLREVTPKEVRDMLAIGLKSEEELHPDFVPGDGKKDSHRDGVCRVGAVPVPVLAEPESRHLLSPPLAGEARESTTETVGRPERETALDSRGGQPPLLNLTHVFREVERRFGV